MPAALILLLLILLLAVVRLAPPAPAPASAAAGEFSGGRARALLAELAGDGAPHPVGSAAAAGTRARVLDILRRAGYAPVVEEGFACHWTGSCATVENVVAELPGSDPANAVLLAAHYDSVPAGPGVSDDLAGVAAALEVARALKAGPQPRNSIVFLLDEGEEAGLLGAEAFVASSPEARRVRAAVNLEARGTDGPSLMFETSRDNAWLLRLFAASVPHPATSSIFATIYEQLPNDTDLTVFKRAGISGLNFAYLGGAARYHTPLDDLAHASAASLEHHGENAIATVRALAAADLTRREPGRAVFFDVLGLATVRWPAGWTLGIALLTLLLLAVALVRLSRRGLAGPGAVVRGLLAWLLAIAGTGVVVFVLLLVLRLLGGFAVAWPARPLPGEAAFWLVALAVVAAVAGAFRRAGFRGLWLGVWLGWGLAGLVLAAVLPGTSYLFLVPALVAGVVGLALPGRGQSAAALAALLPALAAGVVWFPFLALLYDGLGTGAFPLIAALVAALLTAVLPLFGAAPPAGLRRAVILGAAGLAAVAIVVALLSPPFSPDSPRRLNFTFHQDVDTGGARFL
ncbi:MAG TPA: M20/M25/M40 family metallo-hydrolase, partial [Thermoanaerobaculia bacterium]|nr:M20/M25/M40 family metallo-hydrolase [Thermoanaerobaculia bacterium]